MMSREDFVIERWQELNKLKEEKKDLLRLLNRSVMQFYYLKGRTMEIDEIIREAWDRYQINGSTII